MATVLVVGSLPEAATDELGQRGFEIHRVTDGRDLASAVDGGTRRSDSESDGSVAGSQDPDAGAAGDPPDPGEAHGAVVADHAGALDAIRHLRTQWPDLPILFVVPSERARSAAAALQAGAADRVILSGDNDGTRVARRFAALIDAGGIESTGIGSTAIESRTTASRETGSVGTEDSNANAPAVGGRPDGDRETGLLAGARDISAAETARAVGEAVVATAREGLGYHLVTVRLLDDDVDAMDAVARSGSVEAVLDETEARRLERRLAMPASERSAPVVHDADSLADAGIESLSSTLFAPIGDHGVLEVASTTPDAFDADDRRVAELLAANAQSALDRIERVEEFERYETVLETVEEMVYVLDESGVVQYCTPVLAEWLGFERSELIGRDIDTLVSSAALRESEDLVAELLEAPPSATRTQRLDITTAEGETVPAEVDVSLLDGEPFRGVVGTVHDISDLLAVREQLDTQQDRFEYLFENIPDPVVEGYLDDGEATVVSVNPAFEDTFGYEEADIAGKRVNEILVPPDRTDRAKQLDERAAAGEIQQAELERETKYGRREFLFRGVPYVGPGDRMRGFGIYTDITAQRERERHLEVLQRVLRHNVRNDVNVLLAGLEQLQSQLGQSGDVDTDTEDHLIETLDETAANLLTMSQKAKRINRVIGDERDQLVEIDLANLARTVTDGYREAGHPGSLERDLPDRCTIVGSPAIERAVDELVGNALEHAGEDPAVQVRVACQEGGAQLTVHDDGPGIPDAERRVLEEGEITPLQHGSGLGLWLVRHATAASGGTVTFDESADGASVTLSFRRADAPGKGEG